VPFRHLSGRCSRLGRRDYCGRIRGWLSTATAIGQTAKLTAAGFAVLAAVGGLVKAAGGPTWLAIVVPAVGVLGAVIALALGVAEVRTHRREARAELWRDGRSPRPVNVALADDGMYGVGVETEAREALAVAQLTGTHAPYVERDVDGVLRDRLVAASTSHRASLIVLEGPSAAGKSRTALEALRAVAQLSDGGFADAVLVEPRDARALATLGSGPPPRELRAPVPCVVWLDDIERFVTAGSEGLNVGTVAEWFSQWARPVVMLATAGGKGRRAALAADYADPLGNVLRAYPPLKLPHWLSPHERETLAGNPAYSQAAAERFAEAGVGEFMIVASEIQKRLGDEHDCPEGLAVARAVIDWARLGLLRPVPGPALRELYQAYLSGPDLAGRFETGVTWATTVIYSNVALVRGGDPYEPYDYAVRYERERDRPIKPEVWTTIIDRYAATEELSSVGFVASDAHLPQLAEAAFGRADARGDSGGAFNLGVFLAERDDVAGAEAAFRRADKRGHADGAHRLGLLLQERGDRDGAETAFRRADERGHADGAYQVGLLLQERGDRDGARSAFQRAAERGGLPATMLTCEEIKRLARRHLTELADVQRSAPDERASRSRSRTHRVGRAVLVAGLHAWEIVVRGWHRLWNPGRPLARLRARMRLLSPMNAFGPGRLALLAFAGAMAYLRFGPFAGGGHDPWKWIPGILAVGGVVGLLAVVWNDVIRLPILCWRIRRRVSARPTCLLQPDSSAHQAPAYSEEVELEIVRRVELYKDLLPHVLAHNGGEVQIVVGEPGAGKTTALLETAQMLAKYGMVSVLIPLRGVEEPQLIELAKHQFAQLVTARLESLIARSATTRMKLELRASASAQSRRRHPGRSDRCRPQVPRGAAAVPASARSRQRTELTAQQQQILRTLGIEQPPLFLQLAAGQQPKPAA
jgi:TPR repeat protein